MKSKEKQQVKSLDVIVMVAGLAVVSFIIYFLVSRDMGRNHVSTTSEELKKIAENLLRASPDISKNEQRSLASTSSKPDLGQVGTDTWGHPYKYIFKRNDRGMIVHLVVWSEGPNGKTDSYFNGPQITAADGRPLVLGDDIAEIVPIR